MKRMIFILAAALALVMNGVEIVGQTVARGEFESGSGGAYTAGDVVGAAATLNGVGRPTAEDGRGFCRLESLTLTDEANQKSGLWVLFFRTAPPAVSDNGAFAWGSSLTNLVGMLEVGAGDYVTVDSKAVVSFGVLGMMMDCGAGLRDLYVVVVANGTPTYGANKKLRVEFGFGK